MSITIHYVDHNFTSVHFLLGFAHRTVSHSGEVIATQLQLAFTNASNNTTSIGRTQAAVCKWSRASPTQWRVPSYALLCPHTQFVGWGCSVCRSIHHLQVEGVGETHKIPQTDCDLPHTHQASRRVAGSLRQRDTAPRGCRFTYYGRENKVIRQ